MKPPIYIDERHWNCGECGCSWWTEGQAWDCDHYNGFRELNNGGIKMEEQTIIYKTERPDSLEIGTPSKGGVLKVYFNAADKEQGKMLVDNALAVLKHANESREVV